MSRYYDDDSDVGNFVSDDDDGSVYDNPYGARSRVRPRYDSSRRPKDRFGNTGLERFGEEPMALTRRDDRSLSTTGPGRFEGGRVQRRHTFDDDDDYDKRDRYFRHGDSGRQSFKYNNYGSQQMNVNIYEGPQTFMAREVHIHERDRSPALRRSYTSPDIDSSPVGGRKGKSRADTEDSYSNTRKSTVSRLPEKSDKREGWKYLGTKILTGTVVGTAVTAAGKLIELASEHAN